MANPLFEQLAEQIEQLTPDEQWQLRMLLDAKLAETAACTEEELQERLEAAGLLTRPRREESLWHSEPFTPIAIEGEPLSETILRERR